MGNFTFEEMNLMCIYNTGSRTGLIDSLREMRGELAPEETENSSFSRHMAHTLCYFISLHITSSDYTTDLPPFHVFSN